MRKFTWIVVFIFLSTNSFGFMTNNNEETPRKKNYCFKLVKKYGKISGNMNKGVYGAHLIPDREDWRLSNVSTRKKGLAYVFKQKTLDGLEHMAVCRWDKNGFFEFGIKDHNWGVHYFCGTPNHDRKC